MSLSPDHQVAALLALAALIGTVIWALRWIGARVDARLDEHRAAAARRAPRPEYESAATRWHAAPPVMAWSDEIEDQCRVAASEAELARVEIYINDVPFDWQKEGGL